MNEKLVLVALEALRREVGGLPLAFFALQQQQVETKTAAIGGDTPRGGPTGRTDTSLANRANAAAADAFPKIVALIQQILAAISPAKSNLANAMQDGNWKGVAGGKNKLMAGGDWDGVQTGAPQSGSLMTGGNWSGVPRPAPRKPKHVSDGSTKPRSGVRNAFKRLKLAISKPFRSKSAARQRQGQRQQLQTKAAKAARSPVEAGIVKAFGGMSSMLTRVFLPLTAIAGPLAILGQVVNSSASGFSLVSTGVKLLAGTIAPILMPAFFLLATGLAAISDTLWADMQPALEDFYAAIIGPGLDAMKSLLTVSGQLAGVFGEMARTAGFSEKPGDAAANAGLALAMLPGGAPIAAALQLLRGDDSGGGMIGPALAAAMPGTTPGTTTPGATPGAPATPSPPDAASRVRDSARDMIKEFAMSNGPKAQVHQIGAANRSAQMAALNQSPFEAKMLDRIQTIITALNRSVNNTTPAPTPRHP